MQIAMRKLPLALACLACVARGRRLQSSDGDVRGSVLKDSQSVLSASHPTAAFHPSGGRVLAEAADVSRPLSALDTVARRDLVRMQSVFGPGQTVGDEPEDKRQVQVELNTPKAPPNIQLSPFDALGLGAPPSLKQPYELWIDLREAELQEPARAITMNFWRVRGVVDAAEYTLPEDSKIWGVLYDDKSYKLMYSTDSPRPVYLQREDGSIVNVTGEEVSEDGARIVSTKDGYMQASQEPLKIETRFVTEKKELRQAEAELRDAAAADPSKTYVLILPNPKLDMYEGQEPAMLWAMALTGLSDTQLKSVEDNVKGYPSAQR